MASGQLIALAGCEPRVGCRTLASALSEHWANNNLAVMVLKLERSSGTTHGEMPLFPDMASWIMQFRHLPPALIRNSFFDNAKPAASRRLLLKPEDGVVLGEAIGLLKSAFQW